MKLKRLLLIGLGLLLIAGCASNPHASTTQRPPTAAWSPASKILVISAVYGSGTSFADVTAQVDDLLYQPGVKFYARPEWLNADPTPGWNKALVIVYEFEGRRHIFTTGEGGKVSAEQLVKQAKKKRRGA